MLDMETLLPQPQTPRQPTQPVFPPLLDMCPGLSPAARLSLTPSRGLIASSLLWKQNLSGDLTPESGVTARGTCVCYNPLVQSHSGSSGHHPFAKQSSVPGRGLGELISRAWWGFLS